MSTRRALLLSFLDRYSGLAITVISSMIIARLLKPEEIGVFSVAMAMLAFVATMRDMGAGQYIVQAQDVDDGLLKAVWTILFSVGLTLSAAIALLAVPVSSFYGEPRLREVMWVMALTYLLTPIGAITYALLMREMRFGAIAIIRFCSSLAIAFVSITLALQDMGPISLAWGAFAGSAVTAVTSLFFRRHRQPWALSFSGARAVLTFGGQLTATSMINTVVTSTPDFAIGKMQGMHEAGLYSRSNGLVAMVNRLFSDAIWAVASAHFAKQKRELTSQSTHFLFGLSVMTLVGFSFAIVLGVLADPITRVLYGNQWGESVALTQLLAVASALTAGNSLCIALVTGVGRGDLVLRATLMSGVALVVAALVGAAADLSTLGQLVICASAFSGFVWLQHARLVCDLPIRSLSMAITRSALTALIGCGILFPISLLSHFRNLPAIVQLAVGFGLCALGLTLSMLLTKHELASEVKRVLRGREGLRT
jgi:O-antigen/teichoic acid export membrane protein